MRVKMFKPKIIMNKTFSVLHKVHPKIASYAATQVFLTPPPFKPLKEQEEVIKKGTRLQIYSGKRKLRGWRWGNGPTVLLVHGWAGVSCQYSKMIEEITARGFSVIAFDLPAHGASEGRQSNYPECVRAIEAITNTYGPFHAVVAHSFGALCVAAVNDIASKKVFINPLSRARYAVLGFHELTGIPMEILEEMQKGLERRFEIDFNDYSMKALGVTRSGNLLVIHDEEDKMIPRTETLDWIEVSDQVKFLSTKGLGHLRILSQESTINDILNFLETPKLDIRQDMLSVCAL